MSSHRIPLQSVLQAPESRDIDRACAPSGHGRSMTPMAAWLQRRFDLAMTLDPAVIDGYTRDGSNLAGQAQALVRPRTEHECAVILRAAFTAGIPVTISGGKSNLTGSATPLEGILLSTERLQTPAVRVAAAARTVIAPVGMILEDLRNAVRAQTAATLQFPVDPTSRADASVGGSLACNASGFTPGETGAMRAWVRALRFLLPDGRCIAATRDQYRSQDGRFLLTDDDGAREWPVPSYPRPPIKNAGGPYSAPDGCLDFVDLAIGSEGIFGMVTACVLDLAPAPSDYLDLFFSLPGESAALQVLEAARARFRNDLSVLSAFEYFGVHCRNYMDHETRFFHGDDPVGIYIQEPLFEGAMEDAAERWIEILDAAGLDLPEASIRMLDTAALRTLFMEARHSMPAKALEVVQRRGTFTLMTDTVVPPDRFRAFLEFTHARIREHNLDYLAFGHLGDCHLHFTLLPQREQVECAVAVYDDIVAASADLGGVYSGEHGTGKRKRQDFLRGYGPDAVAALRRSKRAVDPQWLLNRGNVIEAE